MMSTILLMDETIAFSRLLYSIGEVAVEWPDDVQWTPYGYFIPINNLSGDILDFLEYGPHSPCSEHGVKKYGEGLSRAVMVDHLARVWIVDLDNVKTDTGHQLSLYKHRIMSGAGARWVYSDTVLEHEKAIMAMRVCPDLEEALSIYLDNSLMFQHQYGVYDIPAIAEELRAMGYTLPLP